MVKNIVGVIVPQFLFKKVEQATEQMEDVAKTWLEKRKHEVAEVKFNASIIFYKFKMHRIFL